MVGMSMCTWRHVSFFLSIFRPRLLIQSSFAIRWRQAGGQITVGLTWLGRTSISFFWSSHLLFLSLSTARNPNIPTMGKDETVAYQLHAHVPMAPGQTEHGASERLFNTKCWKVWFSRIQRLINAFIPYVDEP